MSSCDPMMTFLSRLLPPRLRKHGDTGRGEGKTFHPSMRRVMTLYMYIYPYTKTWHWHSFNFSFFSRREQPSIRKQQAKKAVLEDGVVG